MIILLGFLVGFIAAIPLGPVNVYVISQVIKRDFLHGFLAGLTAAVLDIIYCFVAIVGIFQVPINLSRFMPMLKIIASLLLTAIGIRLIQQSKNYIGTKSRQKLLLTSPRSIFGVFILYVTNPTLYAFWLAVAGTVTAHHLLTNKGWPPFVFSIACGIGSILWYFILVKIVSKRYDQFQPGTFRKILIGLGIVLIVFAAYSLIALL